MSRRPGGRLSAGRPHAAEEAGHGAPAPPKEAGHAAPCASEPPVGGTRCAELGGGWSTWIFSEIFGLLGSPLNDV